MKDKSTIKIVYHVTHVCISLVYCKFGLHDKSHVGFIKSLFKKKKNISRCHLQLVFETQMLHKHVLYVIMSSIQTCIPCFVAVFEHFLTKVLSCQFQSEPGLSQSQLQPTR